MGFVASERLGQRYGAIPAIVVATGCVERFMVSARVTAVYAIDPRESVDYDNTYCERLHDSLPFLVIGTRSSIGL